MRLYYLTAISISVLAFLTQIDSSLIKLDLFEINKTLNFNGFPKYFGCKFKIFDYNYSIIFKASNRIYNEFDLKRFSNLFSEYESVDILNSNGTGQFFASAVLFLNEESFSKLDINQDHSNNELWNLKKDFQVNLKIFQKKLHEINDTIYSSLELMFSMYSDPKQTNPSECFVEKNNRVLSFLKDIVRSKRSVMATTLKKYHLTVEVCVHVQYAVYMDMVKFLGTNNKNYIYFYMALAYAHDFKSVNNIYERISDPLFSFKVQLVKLFIHTRQTSELLTHGSLSKNAFIRNVNEYFKKSTKDKNCDHIMFVTNEFQYGLLGLAYVGGICQSTKTSLIAHKFGSNLDQTFAHELGHNIGAHHDNDTNSRRNYYKTSLGCDEETLMSVYSSNTKLNHVFSHCSISDFKHNLFKSNLLKSTFKCLTEKNFFEENLILNIKHLAKDSLQGEHYSFFEQCQMYTGNKESVAFSTQPCELWCDRIEGGMSIAKMDGAKCDNKNGICYESECINSTRNEEHVISAYTKAALLLRDLCPHGASQEKSSHVISARRNFEGCHAEERCTDPRSTWYQDVCCEACLKFHLKNIVGPNVTCQSFDGNPCFNGGLCKTVNSRKSVYFDCQCPQGFRGPLCLDMSPCELNPCNEFEVCHEYGGIGFYHCLCPTDQTNYLSCRKTFYNSSYFISYWTTMPEDPSRSILVLMILNIFNAGCFACISYYFLSQFLSK